MSSTDFASVEPDPLHSESIRIAAPLVRLLAIRALTILGAAVVGGLVGGIPGLWIGAVIGLLYVVGAAAAGGHFALDLHNASILDTVQAPETRNSSKSLAVELGIEPPSIYVMEGERPQMCVGATGFGRDVVGRIGVTKAFLQTADESRIAMLVCVAMARIWTGEATLLGQASAMAGLPFLLASSRLLNGSRSSKMRDLDCGLSPLGKMVLIVSAPFSRLVLLLAGTAVSILHSDRAAVSLARRLRGSDELESAIRWLHDQQSPVLQDPIASYNPVEAISFVVSPFEVDYKPVAPGDAPPLWKRARFLVTSVTPPMELRISRMIEEESLLGPATPSPPQVLEPEPVRGRMDF